MRTLVVALAVCGAGGFQVPSGSKSLHQALDQALASASASVETIRCPFWRRRATDALEAGETIAHFLGARHKSLAQYLPGGKKVAAAAEKRRGRASTDIAADLEREFTARNYYTSGRLDFSLYRDDALFDAPDPDMPVRSPRKFADALSGLFDARASSCELLDLQTFDDRIVALWRLEGVLRLPWRPTIKPFVGETTYFLDHDRLIAQHLEEWSITALDAFVSTVFDDSVLSHLRRPAAPSATRLREDPEASRALVLRRRSGASSGTCPFAAFFEASSSGTCPFAAFFSAFAQEEPESSS